MAKDANVNKKNLISLIEKSKDELLFEYNKDLNRAISELENESSNKRSWLKSLISQRNKEECFKFFIEKKYTVWANK